MPSLITVPTRDSLWAAEAVPPPPAWHARLTGRTAPAPAGDRYALTAQLLSVHRSSGSDAAEARSVPLSAVYDVRVVQGLKERRRGTGTVVVLVEGDGFAETVSLTGVADPFRVAELITATAAAASQQQPPVARAA